MAKSSATLLLKKPVSTLKKPIEIQPQSFFINATKAIAKGASLDFVGAGERLLDMVSAAGLKDKAEEMAWVLIYQSMMLSVAELVQDSDDLFNPEPTDERKGALGKQLEETLSGTEFAIDADFFDRPQGFSLLNVFKPLLKNWLEKFSLNAAQAEVICERLPDKFTLMLHSQWLENADDYDCIKKALATPFTSANAERRRWMQYSVWLKEQVNERMFHEPFSLQQVYVSPRAYYEEKLDKDQRDDDKMGRADHDEDRNRIAVDLHKELIQWAQNFDQDDAFRVISGGPGSGKSSLSKMLATELAEHCGFPILFVPLHQFDPETDLIKAVEGFVRNNRYLSGNPLDVQQGEDRLLIIFDGLDELSEQGKNAAEIAKSFVDVVIRDINNHNNQKLKRQVLITGRDLAVQSSLSSFRGSHQVYHLLPYFVNDEEREEMECSGELLESDLRDLWWQRYGTANGKNYDAMPKALKTKQLEEITSQPLLNYLVALSYERGELDFGEQTTLNRIYNDLLEAVYKRDYEGRVHKEAKHLEPKQFFRVLEEIALAIWHGDGRTATIEYIEQRCNKSKLTKYLHSFEDSAKRGVTRLLTAFYFRQCSESQKGDRSFEFTHKSFGEYLTARRLVRMLERVCDMLQRQDDDPDEGWDEREALKHWAELCGPTTMDEYVHRFVKDEVALRTPEQWQKWQQCLCRLIESTVKHGLPMEQLDIKTFAQMRAQSRNADECLLVMLSACSALTKVISKINWPSSTAFGSWIKQLQGQRSDGANSLTLMCLGYLNLKGNVLDMQDFFGSRLIYSNLENVQLYGSSLEHAHFENANLSKANLTKANLIVADLTGVDLTGAELSGADLIGADLTRAKYDKTQFSEKQLKQIKHLNPDNH